MFGIVFGIWLLVIFIKGFLVFYKLLKLKYCGRDGKVGRKKGRREGFFGNFRNVI